MSLGYYDRQGQRISLDAWMELHGTEEYKRVAEDTIGSYWVSTVWLGLDHGFGHGAPVIFETMVFQDAGSLGLDIDMARYTSEEQAIAGHEQMCLLIRGTIQETPPQETHEQA